MDTFTPAPALTSVNVRFSLPWPSVRETDHVRIADNSIISAFIAHVRTGGSSGA
jgi:hypothetical protein